MYETIIDYHKILLKENFRAAPDKTYFMLKKVKFLGHIIEDKKVKPLTSRIDGFQKLEPPTNMKALQRYLGTINFFAKYVYGMQPILQPLYNLLHKENNFKWTKEHQQTFEQMKRTITHKLELTMPDTTKSFYMITDASNTGIGAALLQQHPTERKMKLKSANSRLFTPIEMQLSTLIREWSRTIFALTEYGFLLTSSNHPIVLFTDHKPLIYLFTQKNKPNHRVYRFQLILTKFPNLHIIWTEGKASPPRFSKQNNRRRTFYKNTRYNSRNTRKHKNFFSQKHHLQTTSNANTAYVTIPMTTKQIKRITQF